MALGKRSAAQEKIDEIIKLEGWWKFFAAAIFENNALRKKISKSRALETEDKLEGCRRAFQSFLNKASEFGRQIARCFRSSALNFTTPNIRGNTKHKLAKFEKISATDSMITA